MCDCGKHAYCQLNFFFFFLCLRYKYLFLSSPTTAANAKEMLKLELLRLPGEEDQQEDHDLDEPPSRKPRQATSSLDSIFDEIADEQPSASVGRAAVGCSVQRHILERPQFHRKTNRYNTGWLIKCGSRLWLNWWADTFQHLALLLIVKGCSAQCQTL